MRYAYAATAIVAAMTLAAWPVAANAQAAPPAVLRGFVLADSTEQPLGGAEVAIASLSLRVRADSTGAFRLGGLPAGTYLVSVRMLGFEPLSARLRFAPGDSVERDFLLVAAPRSLEAVNVTARGNAVGNPKLATFEERMSGGHGHFVTRAALDSMSERRIGDIIASRVPGATVVSRSSAAWVGNHRGSGSLTRRQVILASDRARGADPRVCYAAVYLDGALVYGGQDGESLFDINSLQPNQVLGIEYYAGGAQMPMELNATSNTCGVLVIWTRSAGIPVPNRAVTHDPGRAA